MLWNNGALFDFEILILTLKSSSPYFYIDLMITFGNRIFFFRRCHTPRLFDETLLTLNLAPWTTVPWGGSVWQGATRRATVSETGKDVLPVRFETGEEVNWKKHGILGKFGVLEFWGKQIYWLGSGEGSFLTILRMMKRLHIKKTCNIFFWEQWFVLCFKFIFLFNIYLEPKWPPFWLETAFFWRVEAPK